MSSRYHGRKTKETSDKIYKSLLDERDLKHIRHHTTPKLAHPTDEERENMTTTVHVWAVGDRFYKLAHKYYGDSRYWWVIAWWNSYPTEASVRKGTKLLIPVNITDALRILEA